MKRYYNANTVKPGLKVLMQEKLLAVVSCEYVKPGKGQAFTRIKLKDMKNNQMIEYTMKVGEQLVAAHVIEHSAKFMYHNPPYSYFLLDQSLEEMMVDQEIIQDKLPWLKTEMPCHLMCYDNTVVSISIPNFIVLLVKHSDPDVRGDSASSNRSKMVLLENDVQIKVPSFVQTGDQIKIDTRDSSYIERYKA